MSSHDSSRAAAARVVTELEALGEVVLTDEEREIVGVAWSPERVDAPTIAEVAFVAELSGRAPHVEPLGQLAQRRVWRAIARRAADQVGNKARSAGVKRSVFAVVFASAAAWALVPTSAMQNLDHGGRAVEIEDMGEAARAALSNLDGLREGARAEALAQTYAARLRDGGAR